MKFRGIRAVAGVMALVLLAACANKAGFKNRSLYQRLGGKGAIVAMADDFAGNVAADPRINRQFASANMDRLKKMLAEQICQMTGGPCVYRGLDMKTAHLGRNIDEAGFNAFVGDLAKTLDKFKVPEQEKNELLSMLAAMKKDIVTK